MQEIRCPRCSAPLFVRADTADAHGRVRLRCDGCGAAVLVKVNARTLRLSRDLATTDDDLHAVAVASERDEPIAQWALLVHALPASAGAPLRQALLTLPRYHSNPNKLHDVLAELPYVLHGLSRGEAAHLHRQLTELTAEFEGGAQDWLLDAHLVPIAEDLRGARPTHETLDGPAPDEEVSAAEPLEIAFDVSELRQEEESWMAEDPNDLVLLGESDEDEHPEAQLLAEIGALDEDGFDEAIFSGLDPSADDMVVDEAMMCDEEETTTDEAPGHPLTKSRPGSGIGGSTTLEATLVVDPPPQVAIDAVAAGPGAATRRRTGPVLLQDELPDTEETGDEEIESMRVAPEPAGFPIVTIPELLDRRRVLDGVSATITRSSATFDVAAEAASDAALRDGLALLRARAEELGGDAIVGLRVATSALPSKIGWIQIYVLTGTAVAR